MLPTISIMAPITAAGLAAQIEVLSHYSSESASPRPPVEGYLAIKRNQFNKLVNSKPRSVIRD